MNRLTSSLRSIGVAALLLASLSACQTNSMGTKQTWGTVLGAGAGAAAGSQFGKGNGKLAAVAAGTLLGAFIGNEVGASLDRADRAAMQTAEAQAHRAPVGQQIAWNNPDSGNHGTVTPVRDGRSNRGEYCREYRHRVNIGGKIQDAYGTACQQPDGSWRIAQ